MCAQTLYIGILAGIGTTPEAGGFRLDSGHRHTVTLIEANWNGRFWARTGCDANVANCATGDCGGGLHCAGRGGRPPASLAEMNMQGAGDMVFYDVSLVDGYNVPMSFGPLGAASNTTYECGTPTCVHDLLPDCPGPLQLKVSHSLILAAFRTRPVWSSAASRPATRSTPTSTAAVVPMANRRRATRHAGRRTTARRSGRRARTHTPMPMMTSAPRTRVRTV